MVLAYYWLDVILKIIFFGLGSIGTRHYNLIKKHFDFDCYSFTALGRRFGEVKKIKPDVAFITCPTYLHIGYAQQCADMGMALFIEKPIDCQTLGLSALLDTVKANYLTTYIAYNLRHHADVRYIKKRIEDRPIRMAKLVCRTNLEAWRPYATYSKYAHQGGGALLELSHEIDLAEYLFGKIVKIDGYTAKIGAAPTDAEDYASLITMHENGNKTDILLDLGSKAEQRTIEVKTDDFECKYHLEPNDKMWWHQLGYFFDNINNSKMMNNLADASDLFRKIIDFRKAHS
jgi:predicted dehydrogenase